MTATNFPNGITSFGVPILGSGIPVNLGSTFFVNSVTGSASNPGTSPDLPFATITGALAVCTANKGDVIVVAPGHAETLSGVGALTIATAGVSIMGLGNRANRPTLTLHTTATTIAISAANVFITNIRIKTDVDAVVSCFVITGADCVLDRVDFIETAACAALQFILTTAGAVGLTLQNCRWIQTATAATALQQWVVLVGVDRFQCINCFANLKGFATANPANGVIVGATTASVDVLLLGNTFITTNSTGAVPISMLSASTGFARDNNVASAKTAIAGSIALASLYGANNYAAHVVNKNGLLEPVVDA